MQGGYMILVYGMYVTPEGVRCVTGISIPIPMQGGHMILVYGMYVTPEGVRCVTGAQITTRVATMPLQVDLHAFSST